MEVGGPPGTRPLLQQVQEGGIGRVSAFICRCSATPHLPDRYPLRSAPRTGHSVRPVSVYLERRDTCIQQRKLELLNCPIARFSPELPDRIPVPCICACIYAYMYICIQTVRRRCVGAGGWTLEDTMWARLWLRLLRPPSFSLSTQHARVSRVAPAQTPAHVSLPRHPCGLRGEGGWTHLCARGRTFDDYPGSAM